MNSYFRRRDAHCFWIMPPSSYFLFTVSGNAVTKDLCPDFKDSICNPGARHSSECKAGLDWFLQRLLTCYQACSLKWTDENKWCVCLMKQHVQGLLKPQPSFLECLEDLQIGSTVRFRSFLVVSSRKADIPCRQGNPSGLPRLGYQVGAITVVQVVEGLWVPMNPLHTAAWVWMEHHGEPYPFILYQGEAAFLRSHHG